MFSHILLIILMTISFGAQAQMSSLLEITNLSFEDYGSRRVIGLPYAFDSDATDFAYGGAVVARGYGQEDLAYVLTGYTSNNDSYGIVGGIYNYRLKNISNRLFVDFQHDNNKKTNDTIYFNENINGSQQNDTSQIVGQSESRITKVRMSYTLSVSRDGKVKKSDDFFNNYLEAFITGAKKISFGYNDEQMGVTSDGVGEYFGRTKAFNTTFEYDGRDEQGMPTDGTRSIVSFIFDPGFEDLTEYGRFEFDQSAYFLMPELSYLKVHTLNLNFFVSDVLYWDEDNLPPWFAQSNLGGSERMRGYRKSRFYGRRAIYGSVEHRIKPKFNFFKSIPLVKKLDIPWWQLVTFLETGSVDNRDRLNLSLNDFKFSYGAGISVMVEGMVARCDLAFGEDTYYLRFFVNQTF